jgi:hypothetical protein
MAGNPNDWELKSEQLGFTGGILIRVIDRYGIRRKASLSHSVIDVSLFIKFVLTTRWASLLPIMHQITFLQFEKSQNKSMLTCPGPFHRPRCVPLCSRGFAVKTPEED